MKDRFGAAVAAAALLLALAFTTTAIATEEEAEAFRVENPTIDLGEIMAGRSASAVFRFHNDGPEDVRIIRAKPS